MSSTLSSSDDSDFEDTKWSLKSKGKSRLYTILSDDEEISMQIGEAPLLKSCETKGNVEIRTVTIPKIPNNTTTLEDIEFISESYAIGSPSKKKSKKNNQMSILAFSQQTIRRTGKTMRQNLETVQGNNTVECPICFMNIDADKIEAHADSCADGTSLETLNTITSQKDHQFSDILDTEIFDDEVNLYSKVDKDIIPDKSNSSKRASWNLQNSFGESNDTASRNPPKRKKTSVPVFKPDDLTLAPYPDFKESAVRGCLRYTGNNPGNSIQSLLKNKSPKPSVALPSNSGIHTSAGSGGFGFKLHPFLAQASISPCNGSGSLEGAVIPDGEGGFIINDDILAEESDGPSSSFALPSFSSNGFIDFQNQFKENSTPRAKKSKPKKSPRKKRSWKSRGRGYSRGRGRGRRS